MANVVKMPRSEPRIIKTARSEKAINEAVGAGFFPLVKKLQPSPDIKSKFAIYQDKKTGRIIVTGDYRFDAPELASKALECVVDFTFFYPYHFESPFGAYLIPKDLEIGERVMLEDLIEDLVGSRWSQGDALRLERCEAIWNGKEFEVQYEPDKYSTEVIG